MRATSIIAPIVVSLSLFPAKENTKKTRQNEPPTRRRERRGKKNERKPISKAVVNRVAQKALKSRNVQLDRDPLKEWLLYVLVIGTMLVFVGGSYLAAAVMHDSSYLCLVKRSDSSGDWNVSGY